jgi:hypothetical protein
VHRVKSDSYLYLGSLVECQQRREILVVDDGDLKVCQQIWRSRNRPVRVAGRAQMLLVAAQGCSNRGIALKLGVNACVVGRVRPEYGRRGLTVLGERPRSGRPRSKGRGIFGRTGITTWLR